MATTPPTPAIVQGQIDRLLNLFPVLATVTDSGFPLNDQVALVDEAGTDVAVAYGLLHGLRSQLVALTTSGTQ